MSAICKSVVVFFICMLSTVVSFSQCDLSNIFGSFDIPDDDVICLSVDISGVVDDDLSANTLFEAVILEFQHQAVSDLLIELTSPDGQTITLIGDIDLGPPTQGTSWDVIFERCTATADPDSGISETWDNAEPWVSFGTYSGSYYPAFGCFSDFNTGSVNGTWQICIRDGFQFNTGRIERIGFIIDGASDSGCTPVQCNPEAGDQTIPSLTVCTNDDLQLDLGLIGNTPDPDYTLVYLVSQNNLLSSINTDGNFLSLAAGQYDICAVSVKNEDLVALINTPLTYQEIIDGFAAGSLPFCADLTDNCTSVSLIAAPAVARINRVICAGEGVSIGTDVFTTSGSFGAVRPKSGTDLCDTNVVLNLEVIDIDPVVESTAMQFSCSVPEIVLDAGLSEGASLSTFRWRTVDGRIDGNPNLDQIIITQPGTYTLEQSLNECTLERSITIGGATDIPQVSISSPVLTCEQDVVILTVNTAASITAATWTGPAGFTSSVVQPSANRPGLYQALLTDNTGCRFSIRHEVAQSSELPVITAFATNLSCGVSAIQISVSDLNYETYRWNGPFGFVSNLAEPDVTRPGTYFLEVQDTSGCKGFTSLQISGDVSTLQYEVSGSDFKCNGGRVTISASTPSNNAIYRWTGPNGFFSSTASNAVTATGTYFVEIISNGCVARDSIVLERDISDLPEYDFQIENLGDCENPLWRFTAIPLANEFQTSLVRWILSGVGVIGSGNTIDVTQPGRYTLYVNTFNGCVVARSFTIDPFPSSPVVQLTNRIIPNCTNVDTVPKGTIEVTDDPNYNYAWTFRNDISFTATTPLITDLDPGFYDLLVTDQSSGCVTSFTANMPQPDTIPRIISTRHTDINCNNSEANIILSANGGGNSYSWSGPGGNFTTPSISVDTAGLYHIIVTGGNGCITMDSIEVLDDTEPPDFTLSNAVLECETQSVLLDPGNTEQGVTYNWAGPDDFIYSSSSPVVFATGEYFLTLTGLNGCVAETSLSVNANPDTPVPIASVLDTLTCIDTLITIFSEATVPVVSYSWDGPGIFTSDEQNPLVSTPGEYIVTIRSTEGCIGFDTITVAERIILPDVNYSFDEAIDCVDNTSTLQGISSDPAATFSWTGPNGYSQSGQSAIATETGNYVYFVKGSNNCVASDAFLISPDTTSFSSSYTSNCAQPGIIIDELSDLLSYTIDWTGPSGFSSTSSNPIPTQEGEYVAFVSGSNGCIANVTTAIVLDTISPTAGLQQLGEVRCEDNIISLNATGSSTGDQYTYSWSTSNGVILQGQDSFTSQVQGTGDYLLSVDNNLNGCTNSLSIQVSEAEVEFISIDLETANPRCFGENNGTVRFTDGFGGTLPYSLSLDNIFFSADSILGNLAPNTYTLTVKDSFGCIVQEQFTIEETEELELDLGENIDVFLGDDVQVSANTNLTLDQIESIQWQIQNLSGCSDCLSFELTPSEDQQIELTLINDRGCIISDRITVRVDDEPVLFKPNIFSPNGDGSNDIFYIHSNPGVAKINAMSIFDRWGNSVFTKQNFLPGDPENGWNGTTNGNRLQPGVYIYTIEVEMITGVTRMQRGNVTLVR